MSVLEFAKLSNADGIDEVIAMMRQLYIEDAPAEPVDPERFPRTIQFLLAETTRGSILVITEEAAVCGYAILIPYWSNEFGGTLLCVDELFVKKEARNRGIAHRFFEFLERTRPFDPVAIALEVSPGNSKANRLYQSIGFNLRRNRTLIRRLQRAESEGRNGH